MTCGGGAGGHHFRRRLDGRRVRHGLCGADGDGLDPDETLAGVDVALHLEPSSRVDARIDVQIEALPLRSSAHHPDARVGQLDHEVELAARRACRLIPEEVPAAEPSADRHRLSVESQWVEREAAHRRCGERFGLDDLTHDDHQQLALRRPFTLQDLLGQRGEPVRGDALVVLREAADVDERPGHLDIASDLGGRGIADREQACLPAEQGGAHLVGDQLGAHPDRPAGGRTRRRSSAHRGWSPCGPRRSRRVSAPRRARRTTAGRGRGATGCETSICE